MQALHGALRPRVQTVAVPKVPDDVADERQAASGGGASRPGHPERGHHVKAMMSVANGPNNNNNSSNLVLWINCQFELLSRQQRQRVR